jgi:nucleoid DNA-binding protein
LTRRDLVQALSPSRVGSEKSKWDPYELSRPQATKVVNVFFESIAAALKQGEKVTTPIGTFEVLDRKRPPLRRWFLGRGRVTYVQRKYVKFTPSARCLKQVAVGVKKGK